MIHAKRADDPSEGDYVVFHSTGEAAKGEFRCCACGYGVAVFRELPACPMCGGTAWEEASRSPFRRAAGRAL